MKWLWLLSTALLSLSAHSQVISIVASGTIVCAQDTVVFSAVSSGTSTPHYHWLVNGTLTGGDSATLITDTLDNNDTVRCRLTDTLGATLATSGSIIMQVNPLSDAGVITGPAKVCVGTTVTMADTTPGGNWSVSSSRLVVDSNGVVKGMYASYYTCDSFRPDEVYYTVSNGCGIDTASETIVVNAQPDASFYISLEPWGTLCAGGRPYALVSPNCDPIYSAFGKIAISGHSISMGAAGSDSIYCIATNYCGTSSDGTWLYFGGPPEFPTVLSHLNELCMGMSDTLKTSDPCFWTSAYHKVSLQFGGYSANAIITAIDTGSDIIGLETRNDCGSAYNSINITVNANPDSIRISPEECIGSSAILFDSTGGGSWSSSEDIATIDKNTITYHDIGITTIRYVLDDGCETSARVLVHDCSYLAVFELFPNPAIDELIVHQMKSNYNSYTVTNSLGQIIIPPAPITKEYTSINMRSLVPALYYLRLTGNGGSYVTKILKE